MCAPVLLAGCGGTTGTIASIEYHPYLEAGAPALTASKHPRGRYSISLSSIDKSIPRPLPQPLKQPVGRGVARYITIKLASGRAITYGGLKWPPSISRLRDAMVRVAER
jgi:hypothetical protein